MAVYWKVASLAFSLGAVPHVDVLHSWGTTMLSTMNINTMNIKLDESQPCINDEHLPAGTVVDADCHGATDPTFGIHFETRSDGGVDITPPGSKMGNLAWGQLTSGIFISALFAFCYKSNVTDKRDNTGHKQLMQKDSNPDGSFKYGLCGCFSNCSEGLCAYCCPGIKFADAHTLVTGSFWQAFGAYVAVQFVTSLVAVVGGPIVYPPPTYTLMPGWNETEMRDHVATDVEDILNYFGNLMLVIGLLASVLRGLYFGCVARKALREKLGAEVPPAVMATDCLAWSFCSCCALTQEAVEVDIATNSEVSCPCTLIKPRQKGVGAREVAPCDYEKLLGDAVVLEEGGR